MKLDKKKLARQIGSGVLLFESGGSPASVYDLRDFPYLQTRSGASSKSCMRNAVRGYTE